MKLAKRLTAISAAFVCSMAFSASADEFWDAASAQILSNQEWQETVPQLGNRDVAWDWSELFAEKNDQLAKNEASFGTNSNYTTLPAAAFDGSGPMYTRWAFIYPPVYPEWPGNLPAGHPLKRGPGHILICLSPYCVYDAPVLLPSGVRVTRIQLAGLDNDPGPLKEAGAALLHVCQDGQLNSLAITDTSGAAPNIFAVSQTLSHTIDNENCQYSAAIVMAMPSVIPANIIGALQVKFTWERQISPAPATASFNDVPTGHTFFREVEALYASGITGGCGGNNYCVDNPVTRGQMAAYLARGLGL